jgi:hypothetical protein
MGKLIFFAVIGVLGWKLLTGRWPWEPKTSTRAQAVFRARKLLGVSAAASREDIVIAHRRLIAMVHPDRGGTDSQVHEANAARDLLLDELPYHAEPK